MYVCLFSFTVIPEESLKGLQLNFKVRCQGFNEFKKL